MQVSTQDKLRSLKRELALRRNIYPKWTANGRMKASEAAHEIAVFEALVKDLEAIVPHAYVPSIAHQGDCAVCGHLQDASIHGGIDAL